MPASNYLITGALQCPPPHFPACSPGACTLRCIRSCFAVCSWHAVGTLFNALPLSSGHHLVGIAEIGFRSLCGSTSTPVFRSHRRPAGSADMTVRLWSVELGRCLHAFRGHLAPVWAVAANPHGHYFASGSNDCTAMVWAVDQPTCRRILVRRGMWGEAPSASHCGCDDRHCCTSYSLRRRGVVSSLPQVSHPHF